MTVEIPPPEKGAGNPPEKGGDGDAGKAEKVYKQTQVDDFVNERSKRLKTDFDSQLSEKDKEIDKLRKAQMSDEEKRIQGARDEGAKPFKDQLAERDRRDAHKDAYLEGGINPKRVSGAFTIVKEHLAKASPEEALAFLKKDYPEFFADTSKSFGPGDGITKQAAPQGGWTSEEVEKALDGLTPEQQIEWWNKNGAAVEEFQRRHYPFRTIAPGVPTVAGLTRK